MKLQFDSHQDYQLKAIHSVVNIFEGQPLAKSDFEVSFATEEANVVFSEKGIGNHLVLSEKQILKNIQAIQAKNGIKESDFLTPSVSDDKKTNFSRFNFSIEMETGTGKTYTYLRTIYELNKTYGFKKFVIVVPSVAIREGTIKNLKITHDHFQDLYGHTPIHFVMYDRKNITTLRNFATSNVLQILVINVDSFTKDNNVINSFKETGIKPIEYLQSTNPILIIDEPQNFETDVRRQAIKNLNPLCTLRYSATHRNLYNLVYSLNPIQAYDLGLVKQIEVDGITSDNNYNAAFIQFKSIQLAKNNLKAKLAIYVIDLNSIKLKNITVDIGDDLFNHSNSRDIYKDGFILNSINAAENVLTFSNGIILKKGETHGGLDDEAMQYQIERTVKWHFEKFSKLKNKDIKVLSLFFIDKVANYRIYNNKGEAQKGKLAVWFETAFNKYKKQFPNLINFEAEQVHDGYFSSDKKGKNQKEIWIDSKEKNAKKDEDTYGLIMHEKEKLLSIDVPLQFIFSHSALREGWDNPNVFQICTLNESHSALKKRQEIGRGLRLPVNTEGVRIQDKKINILTVIANESYEDFSKALQNEIQEETSVVFKDRLKNVSKNAKTTQKRVLTLEDYPDLLDIWERINQKTTYAIDFSTAEWIKMSVNEVKKMPTSKRPLLESKTAHLAFSKDGVVGELKDKNTKQTENVLYPIPDVYNYIQNKIDASRQTIYDILIQSEKYEELEINPQMFLDTVVNCMKNVLNSLLETGVCYTLKNDKNYEITLLQSKEMERYLSYIYQYNKKDKTLTGKILKGSFIKNKPISTAEKDNCIKSILALPKDFKVSTPIGYYYPDWALVFEDETKICFVSDIKSKE